MLLEKQNEILDIFDMFMVFVSFMLVSKIQLGGLNIFSLYCKTNIVRLFDWLFIQNFKFLILFRIG